MKARAWSSRPAPASSKVRKGDRVILGWIKGQGADAQGIRYKAGDGYINAGAVTTFNEYAVVAENRVTLLPQGLPMDVAVLFGCALPVGAGIVINIAKPQAGSTLAVFGLGGIGLSALMACKLFDCKQLIAVDVEPSKLAMAPRARRHYDDRRDETGSGRCDPGTDRRPRGGLRDRSLRG